MNNILGISELISTQLLPRVRRPGQYIGLETNARQPDVYSAEVTVALAFADTYTIGISHLGSQVLYHMLNDIDGVACDRTYCPQMDAEAVMREHSVPLFGWESRAAIRDFDILGFSLPYELCVTNLLTMLDLSGIPLHSEDRGEDDPIIIAGDAMADTPEPLADFIDIFLPGDGEQPLTALVELVRQMKTDGASREEMILQAARTVPSAYVPKYYRPSYDSDDRFAGLELLRDDVPAEIPRACLTNLSDSAVTLAPLVPNSEAVHERVIIEIMRGCPNACRFCQAGATRLPVRRRSVEEIVSAARKAIDATGYREISLLSLSTSDYTNLEELISSLNEEFAGQHVSISLPSLRVDSQLRQLPRLTSNVRKGGLTIAAEAGTDRLRNVLRKNINEEDMLAGVRAAYEAGWRRVKVYFMAGLPGETLDDIDQIYYLCRRLSDVRKEVDGQRGAISASVSWLVPKPHTPMQWCAMGYEEYFHSVRERLGSLARRGPVSIKFHHVQRSLLESLLCRGDRRIGAVIESAWKNGARLDAWNEHFDNSKWLAALEQTGIDPSWYVHREIPTDQPLPWSHIKCHRSTRFLMDEYHKISQ